MATFVAEILNALSLASRFAFLCLGADLLAQVISKAVTVVSVIDWHETDSRTVPTFPFAQMMANAVLNEFVLKLLDDLRSIKIRVRLSKLCFKVINSVLDSLFEKVFNRLKINAFPF